MMDKVCGQSTEGLWHRHGSLLGRSGDGCAFHAPVSESSSFRSEDKAKRQLTFFPSLLSPFSICGENGNGAADWAAATLATKTPAPNSQDEHLNTNPSSPEEDIALQ